MTIIWCIAPEISSVRDRIFCHFGPFFTFLLPLITQKIKIFKKWKNHLEILSFYTCVSWMTIIWWVVPEIWIVTFCVILDCFLPFYPPNNPKNQNFEKMRKTHGDIIILHMYTKNDNHMMYDSWDIERDRQNFLSFGTIFCPFTLLTTWKIKIFKKWKNAWRYYHFAQVYHKWQSYNIWFLRYETWTFYPSNNLKNQDFEKLKKKNSWRYHHFTQVYQNHDHMLYCSLDIVRNGCNCFVFFHFGQFFAIFPT